MGYAIIDLNTGKTVEEADGTTANIGQAEIKNPEGDDKQRELDIRDDSAFEIERQRREEEQRKHEEQSIIDSLRQKYNKTLN